MSTATIAVKGSASGEFPADYAGIHFQHVFTLPARSEALAHGNEVVAQLREFAAHHTPGVRNQRVRSLRVEESFKKVGPEHELESAGWNAHITGESFVETDYVPTVVAELTKLGVSINHFTWHLDTETGAHAHREVRRRAVADALEAAHDFAAALGGTVGDLITLADPGLLSAGAFTGNVPASARATSASFASASSSATPWDERVDIDPAVITVSASVEASYVVHFA
jgi:uncharacterized protein YggE